MFLHKPYKALNGPFCADVLLRNYSLSSSVSLQSAFIIIIIYIMIIIIFSENQCLCLWLPINRQDSDKLRPGLALEVAHSTLNQRAHTRNEHARLSNNTFRRLTEWT